MKSSKAEHLIKQIFNFYFSNEVVYYNFRPDWLKNPETLKNLEFDIYYPKLRLAIEYNGIGHKLEYQRKKDEIKQEICNRLGIQLIIIKNVWRIDKITNIIKSILGIKVLKNLPRKLYVDIKTYKPCKTKFGKYVIRKLKIENYQKIQKEEIEFNRQKMINKELLKVKKGDEN